MAQAPSLNSAQRSLLWMEYSTGLVDVIQLPEMKAPGKQEKLIIYQPYVPGSEASRQYFSHLKLQSVPRYIAVSSDADVAKIRIVQVTYFKVTYI